MARTFFWSLGAALVFAACSNETASTPGGNTGTAGSMALPTSAGGAGTGTGTATAGSVATSTTTTTTGTPTSTATAGSSATTGAAGSSTTPTTPPPSSAGAAGASTTPAGSAGSAAPSGTAGAASPTGMATAGAAGSATPPAGSKPKCISKGAELALVGDSWINYPLGEFLAPRLAQRAQKDGALKQGDMYNDQAVAGTSLASGGLGLIPDQWPTAKAAAQAAGTSVKFVIMDGGGNDVLLGNQACLQNGAMKDQDPACQATVKAATMAGQMLQVKMKMDGVGQAVYFFYPHVPAGGWDVLDYSLPMAKSVCESMNDDKYHCYFVDTREAFQGPGNTGMTMAQLIGPDGIHPNAAGDDVLADLIWKTMKDNCMAQTAESGGGCCEP